jgi:hypothetical protein
MFGVDDLGMGADMVAGPLLLFVGLFGVGRCLSFVDGQASGAK